MYLPPKAPFRPSTDDPPPYHDADRTTTNLIIPLPLRRLPTTDSRDTPTLSGDTCSISLHVSFATGLSGNWGWALRNVHLTPFAGEVRIWAIFAV